MVEIRLNGKPRSIPAEQTLTELLAELALDARWVIVERNGNPVPREEISGVTLQPGDELELVRAVAGG